MRRARMAAAAGVLACAAPSAAVPVCVPRVEWTWSGEAESPPYTNPCSTPLVLPLTDTSGDGRRDAADVPDVVFLHFDNQSPFHAGLITAVSGRGGVHRFTTGEPRLRRTGLAAGDLDGDGAVELVALAAEESRLVAFDRTGALLWTSDPSPDFLNSSDAVSLADLDQDGRAEIFIGSLVWDADGRFLWRGTGGSGRGANNSLRLATAADLVPESPGLELLAGNTAYAPDGSVVWTSPDAFDGWNAVADFDRDGDPEIVHVQTDSVRLLDGRGSLLGAPYPTPFEWLPQPVVADLDGDGLPEVALALSDRVEALEWTGARFELRWSRPTSDPSRLSGATAYDLDGDGADDLVYRDMDAWYILDGPTGAVVSRLPFPSATDLESPVVADLDHDCAPEILVSGCQGGFTTFTSPNAVVAYECASGSPRTPRRMWNQLAYHGTNVEDDGRIPRVEPPSWLAGNGWLAQRPLEPGVLAAAGPDAEVCAGQPFTLDAGASAGCAPGVLEFRWSGPAGVVCNWSPGATCTVTPADTTTYVLDVRCAPGSGCAAASDAVTVTVLPDPLPPDLGNTLRAARAGVDVVLSWRTVPGAVTYVLHRSSTKRSWPPSPLLAELAAPAATLPDVPPPEPLWFYRAAGASCSGREGP